MMIAQAGRPASALHDDIHPTDLSPRSSVGSGSSVRSDSQTSSPSPNSSKENNMIGTQLLQALNGHHTGHFSHNDLSPLQRLQFAFERTTILSNLFPAKEGSLDQRSSPLSPQGQESSVEMTEGGHQVSSPAGSPNSDPANIFQCPLCSIVCNGRHSFNEHLVTHTQHHACPKCDFLTNSEDQLRDHLLQEHDMADPAQALEEEEMSTPKLNAQGKVKTFKCKQCDHLSLTKAESWSHSATHIRPEKMLKCPKCPFVTEYKHHLEYHLRIHVGSKPYQCNVCPYTCVNKSMLNSHLKSHSAVYQYNCLDCDYQTKYCHSLKMHLRKLNHRPSMVLNPDGTPNPLPIIDVYGTRRGPKMKKSQPNPVTLPKHAAQNTQNGYLHSPANSIHSNHSSYSSQGSRDSMDEISPKIQMEPRGIMIPKPKARKPKNVGSPPLVKRHLVADHSSDSEVDRKFHISNSGMDSGRFESKMDQTGNKASDMPKNPLEIYAALNQYFLANPLLLASGVPPEHIIRMAANEREHQMAQIIQTQNGSFLRRGEQVQPIRMHEMAPSPAIPSQMALDLRHPKSDSERRRRKGKAQRYERHIYEEEESGGEMALDFSNNNNYKAQAQKVYKTQDERELQNGGGSMMCKYCEISFPDQILYRMHMSYHSEADPFVCKSCGKRTQDKVSFFLHLTTDSH